MEQVTTYRAKGKTIGLVFLFKYDLNGNLKAFEKAEGEMNPEQIRWLFSPNFPATQQIMDSIWRKDKKYTRVFEIEVSPPDLSFEIFWTLWNLKIKRDASEKAWNKLNEADKIKCFKSFKNYQNHLLKTNQAKAHLVTWLNQKRYNDEY